MFPPIKQIFADWDNISLTNLCNYSTFLIRILGISFGRYAMLALKNHSLERRTLSIPSGGEIKKQKHYRKASIAKP